MQQKVYANREIVLCCVQKEHCFQKKNQKNLLFDIIAQKNPYKPCASLMFVKYTILESSLIFLSFLTNVYVAQVSIS